MPNRSTGCYTCRRRKIRCDGTRPFCDRCAIHGVPCSGYKIAQPGDVEFRDESLRAAKLAGNQVQPQKRESSFRATRRPLLAKSSPNSLSVSSGSDFAPSTPIAAMHSPGAFRTQLYSSFINIHMAQNILPHERGGIIDTVQFGVLKALLSLPCDHPAFVHGMDALSLVSTGSLYRDQLLLRKAVEAYTRALSCLASAIAKPSCLYDDNIMAAVLVLSHCEFYDQIRQQGKGWIHSRGLLQMLAARGPEKLTSEISSLALIQARSASLAKSLLGRQSDFLNSSLWQPRGTPGFVCDVGLRLPSLLERHDTLDLASPSIMTDIDLLLADCERMELDLAEYLSNSTEKSTMPGGEKFSLETVEGFNPFSERVVDRTLTKAFRFPSFPSAVLHSQFWLRMYFLITTVQSLVFLKSRLAPQSFEASKNLIAESEVSIYVFSLCRCIPFFAEPANGNIGHICCFFPLSIATDYFGQNEQWEWLNWARTVRDSIFTRGLSRPKMEGFVIREKAKRWE